MLETKTKTYILFEKRFNKKVLNGEQNALDYFTSLIIPTTTETFIRRKNSISLLISELHQKDELSEEDYIKIKQIISKKIKNKIKRAEIKFQIYFHDIQLLKDIPGNKIQWAFIVLPFFLSSNLNECLNLKYQDIEIKKIENIVLLIYTTAKQKYIVSINKSLSKIYNDNFQLLQKNNKINDYIFPQGKNIEWQINKTSNMLYKIYKSYINENDEFINPLKINSIIKRNIRDADFFKEI